MNNKKLIVFDVGNTLIETKRGIFISESVLKDLFSLREMGYILGLSTLRTEKMLAPILAQFRFDFLILMNGGLVIINEKTVFSMPLEPDTVERIRLQASDCQVKVIEYARLGEIYALELPSAKNIFQPDGNYQYYVWEKSGNIDITRTGVTKSRGFEIACLHYGVSPSDTIAFGDGYNDIDMLSMAGISVAMGGAPEEVARVATITTAAAADDGISLALRELGIL